MESLKLSIYGITESGEITYDENEMVGEPIAFLSTGNNVRCMSYQLPSGEYLITEIEE